MLRIQTNMSLVGLVQINMIKKCVITHYEQFEHSSTVSLSCSVEQEDPHHRTPTNRKSIKHQQILNTVS